MRKIDHELMKTIIIFFDNTQDFTVKELEADPWNDEIIAVVNNNDSPVIVRFSYTACKVLVETPEGSPVSMSTMAKLLELLHELKVKLTEISKARGFCRETGGEVSG